MKKTTIFLYAILVLMYGCGETPQKSDQASGVVYTSEGDVIEKTKADAGDDVSVKKDETVIFDASKSIHKNADIVSYEWSIGDIVLSTNDYFEKSDFAEGKHTIVLTIVDSDGVTSSDTLMIYISKSIIEEPTNDEDNITIDENNITIEEENVIIDEDNITIEAIVVNNPPIADAGEDISLSVDNHVVVFDASKSSDSNGTIVSYEWKENDVILSSNSVFSKSDFVVGVHTITLIVTDNDGSSASDEIIVIISSSGMPIAQAGTDISSVKNENITLDASKSSDSNGVIVKYEWKEGETILSSEKVFSKSDFSVGIHTITLYIEDDMGNSSTDIIKITIIANQAPIAHAGDDQTVKVFDVVIFNAAESKDVDGTIVSYKWVEDDTQRRHSGATFSTSNLSVGTHIITLSVTDDDGLTAFDTVKITVLANGAPTAKAGDDISVTDGVPVSFNALSSSDPDGSIVSYIWKEGNTILSTSATFSKSDFTVGSHNVLLTITDNDGSISTDTIVVTITFLSTSITHNSVLYQSIVSPITGRIWLDRNLGASRGCTSSTDTECYGDYYQWGRETDGHEKSTSITSKIQVTSLNNSSDKFIDIIGGDSDWAHDVDPTKIERSQNWGNINGNSVCPSGFRVPSLDELEAEHIVDESSNSMDHFLKIPFSGVRYFNNVSDIGSKFSLWSMSYSDSYGEAVSSEGSAQTIFTAGYSVRCIKD